MSKATQALEAMRAVHGGHSRGIFRSNQASSAVARLAQRRVKPVMKSPLRPPPPLGAHATPGREWIPESNRGVQKHAADGDLQKNVPAHMNAALRSQHQKLANEVAGGLRKVSFAQVARRQPAGT